ncbi:MAG: YceI family protein [Gallionellaceae bacterium]|jgi:polyisoprenoid-binding protein YceI
MKRLILALMLSIPFYSHAAEYSQLQLDKSKIVFVSKQMNVPVEGVFGKFSADVHINPAKAEKGKAQLEIELASIDAGNAEANDEVKGKNWFDVLTYPKASFVASSVKSLGVNKYEAVGKLSIKGKSIDIHVPFTMQEEKGMLNLDGVFAIKRLDFGIGSGLWSDTSVVANEVEIRFHLVLK